MFRPTFFVPKKLIRANLNKKMNTWTYIGVIRTSKNDQNHLYLPDTIEEFMTYPAAEHLGAIMGVFMSSFFMLQPWTQIQLGLKHVLYSATFLSK